MDISRITSELFELRSRVVAELCEHGFASSAHYADVEIVQETYGLKVCGISNEADALDIRAVLINVFPSWHKWPPNVEKYGIDNGFSVLIERDHKPHARSWEPEESRNPKFSDPHLYDLPYEPSRTFAIMQGYGGSTSHQGRLHYSLDFAMPIGTPVCAARSGIVASIDEHPFPEAIEYTLEIDHEDGTASVYAHLSEVAVRLDRRVSVGETIGRSGSLARPRSPHLHFQVTWLGECIPTKFKTSQGTSFYLQHGRRYTNPRKFGGSRWARFQWLIAWLARKTGRNREVRR